MAVATSDDFLARAFRVLDAFGSSDPVMSLTEIAHHTELPKTTAYRILGRLVDLGAVEVVDNGYMLGMRLFEMGARVHRQRELRETALPFLDALCRVTRQTVHFGVWTGSEVVLLEKLKPQGGPTLRSRLGMPFALHATGLGKAVLAHLSLAAQSDVLESIDFVRRSQRTIMSKAELKRQLSIIRDTHLAIDDEEVYPGVRCVAAPVFGPRGKVIAALSVSGRIENVSTSSVGPAVSTTAMALSNAL